MSSSYQRTDMSSSAWMNGQQQAGPESQTGSQQAFYLMRNQQTGNTNSSCRYQTVNVGGQQAQNANFSFQDGGNRQVSNWQTSVAQHQAASLQQPTGGRNNGSSQRFHNLNNSPQSGNLYLPFSNGAQGANQQQFHHNSFLNSSTQIPHGIKMANTSHTQQNIFYRKHPVNRKQTSHTQDCNVVHDLQHYKGQRAMPQNVNTDTMKTAPPYTAMGTMVVREQAAGTSSPVSGTTPKGQSVHPQNPRQNITQDRLTSSLLPNYQEAVLQAYRNTSNPFSSSQNCNVANLNQRTQQYPAQLNMVQNTGKQTFVTFGDSVQKSYAAASNQATQPMVSTVAQNHRPITPQPLSYYYTHFKLDTSRHSVTSGAQRVADGVSVTTTDKRSGNDKKADGGLSNGNLLGSSLNAYRHLAQMAESLSSQKNNARSLAAYSQQPGDGHDHLQSTSTSPCDSSLHTSPGRTGTRAVAVVQPLSQETCQSGIPSPFNASQSGECTTTDESSCNSGKSCILPDIATTHQAAYPGEDTEVCSVNANQIKSSDCPTTPSPASSISTAVSSSNSPDRYALLKRLLTSHVTEADHSIYLKAHQNAAKVFQQRVHAKVHESKHRDVDETPVDPPPDVSSVPTTPWTKDMLIKLIEDEEKSQKDIQNDAHANSTSKLLNMFWGGDTQMLLSHLKGYLDIMEEVKEFFHKQVTKDSIILSQVKLGFGEELKKYNVVNCGDVYTAPPYKSLWLNVNEQLDDIDKEFGFPWSLMYGLETLKSGRQPDRDGPNDNTPAQTSIKITDDVLISTRCATVDSGDEKQTMALVTTSNESFSPYKTGSSVSDEPHYNFNIEVLSPEEAKRIFQQVQSRKQQDMDSQPGELNDSCLEGQVKVSDIPVIDLLETPPKEVCCVARALETVGGSQVPSTSECQDKKEHTSQTDCADEATATQNDEICLIESDTNFHSAFKEETQVISCTLFSHSELCSDEIIDLTEDDSSLHFAEDLNNLSYMSISDSHSSTSENEDTELISAGVSPSRNSDTSEREIEKVFSCEAASQMSNDEEDCAQDERTSTDVMESVDSPQRTPQINGASSPQTVALHKEREAAEQQQTGAKSPDSKSVSKPLDSKKDHVDVPDSPTTKTVELVLFGSSPQERLPGRRTKSVTFQSGKTAPKLLCVKVGSHDGAFVTEDPVYPGTFSVKQRIHEEWKKSFPPINMKLKKVKKRKFKQSSLSEMCFKVAETSWSTSSAELPASSGFAWNKNAKLSLKKRRSLSNGGKRARNAATRGLTANKTRSNVEVEGEPSRPPRKKFRVSAKSFLWSG